VAELEFEIEIAAPPQLVFAFFVPQRMPYWYSPEMKSCIEVQGGAAEFAAAQKLCIVGQIGKRQVMLTAIVLRCEWGRLLEWRFEDPYGVQGSQSWELSATAHGTHLRMRDAYELPGRFGRILDRLFTRHAVAHRDRRNLARLKRLVENR
jgi:uncharacterized protein YndB with AHSA1/START domain